MTSMGALAFNVEMTTPRSDSKFRMDIICGPSLV